MIVSLNWLKKFIDIDMPVDELTTLIGARLVEIEKVIDLGAKYKDVLVVRVVEASGLDGSDHLIVLKIDDGGVSDCDRDANGYIQVVCGAPNVAKDQMVVWLRPGVTVPNTFDGYKPLVLEAKKLQGVISNGMIASPRELDLYDEHEGILEVDKDVSEGTSFAQAYELNDFLFDIENKSLTHRPDCFSAIGIAREVSAIIGNEFHTPEWLLNTSPDFTKVQADEIELDVSIDNPKLSSRYTAIVMSGADGSKKSPTIIQTYLSRTGVRPVNAIVDVTNYLMMLTGQPLHAFDYDKLVQIGGGKPDIHVRAARENEELELLDGRTITLSTEDIVISAGKTAIALAGAMGGANTEIDVNTKKIIIESATFDLYNLRATQMRHGIFSEAITRYTKGQPALLNAPVLFEAVRLMHEWSGAKCVSKMKEAFPIKQKDIKVEFSVGTINSILGSNYSNTDIINTLTNIEFNVIQNGSDNISVTVPYWRGDIHIIEDIMEEVGRINGFDNIVPTLPSRDFTAVAPNDFDVFRGNIRKLLARAGANEILSYSFIHGNILKKAGQDINNSYRIVNSISPDLQYYRQTLTPSLLDLVHPNIKQGYDNFAIFEINKTHSRSDGLNDENVPIESEMVSLVVANKNSVPGAPFYQAKRILDYLCESLGVKLAYESVEKDSSVHTFQPFEYRRSAKVVEKSSGGIIGVVGEYKKLVAKGFKLPENVAGFEINSLDLFELFKNLKSSYKSLSRFPSSERDVCFQVNSNITFSQVIEATNEATKLSELTVDITPVDIYQPNEGKTKNITIRVKLTANDHTLTGDEVASAVKSMSDTVVEKTNATII